MSHAAALTASVARPMTVASREDVVSLQSVQQLDAAVLSQLVRAHGRLARGGRRIRIVNATPDVARMLRQLGLSWMLSIDEVRDMAPANEPMRRAAA